MFFRKPYQPFTLNDFDRLPSNDEDEEDW